MACRPDLPAGVRFGLSTGWDPRIRSDFSAAMAEAEAFSQQVIELSALAVADIAPLTAFLGSDAGRDALRSFGHVTVHGPAKDLPGDWQSVMADLQALLPGGVQGMVLHPETLTDLDVMRTLGGKLILENMDCRKSACRTAAEMTRTFDALPDARFCLDVAHVWTIDPGLQAGHELLDAFGDRLAQLHVSGINADGRHRVTTAADLRLYAPLLERCAHVPWVFESPYAG